MNTPAPLPPSNAMATAKIFLAGALLVVAAWLAWRGTGEAPFVLDDLENIVSNPSIRRLSAWRDVLSPPAEIGVGGRPVLNATFALNYRLGRLATPGYHAVNLAIHLAAGLVLLGLVRRTLAMAPLDWHHEANALPLAMVIALVWTLHPVQTASVTYLSQRAESLMGLFYLLTIYGLARSVDSPKPGLWQLGSVVACALGMATKEVMVTAPLIALLYDRTFVSGTFAGALRRRRWFYGGLAATWVLLAVLLVGASARGIGTSRGVPWTTYALTECRAVVQYVRLAFWPHPLVIDRGAEYLQTWTAAVPYALVLVPLVLATLFALVRRPLLGFAGAWFFGILAPTSSVVPVAFLPMADNRLYLPLVAVVASVVLALHARFGRAALFVAGGVAVVCGWFTFQRNRVYRDDLALWRETVAHCPENPDAHYNLGLMLSRAGRTADAAAQWLTTLRDQPNHAAAHVNLANALVTLGRTSEALPHYEAALRVQPFFPVARANYGLVLLYLGRPREAEAQLRVAVQQGPDNAGAHTNLGLALDQLGRGDEARAHYETALRLDPDSVDAHHNLGLAFARAGQFAEAIAHFTAVVRVRPTSEEAHLNLTRVLLQANRLADAQAAAEAALARFPKSADAHVALGNVLAMQGQLPAAAAEYERALALKPGLPAARDNLAIVRARMTR